MIGTFTILSVIMLAFYSREYNLFFLNLKAVVANPMNSTTHTGCLEFKYFGTKDIFSFINQRSFVYFLLFITIIFISSVPLHCKFQDVDMLVSLEHVSDVPLLLFLPQCTHNTETYSAQHIFIRHSSIINACSLCGQLFSLSGLMINYNTTTGRHLFGFSVASLLTPYQEPKQLYQS